MDERTKSEIRKTIREQRQSIAYDTARDASLAVNIAIESLPQYQDALHIACYLSNEGEINLNELIRTLWLAHKRCYLPKCIPFVDGHMVFMPYESSSRLYRNSFGLWEPTIFAGLPRLGHQLDLAIVPLVAWDKHGHRLGMGGGYYDRALKHKLEDSDSKPYILGVAYDEQEVDEIPTDEWDVKLDGIVTPNQFHEFKTE